MCSGLLDHIGDPIPWRVMFEKKYRLLISVPPLARVRYCLRIHVCPIAHCRCRGTARRSDVDSWKMVHPSAKVTQEG